MAKNADLNKATRNKKDEFYTQLSMIEEECWHYEEQFKGKTILCNCDDPYESNFFKYFAMRFNALGLKKLICTCYDGSPLAGQEISFEELDAMKAGKRHAYERQKGICPVCKKHFEYEQMQGDHITPWLKGGKTVAENCKMLCADCNRRKSDV